MSNNGDKSKKPANSFAMLSLKMNEVQKSKKPNQVSPPKKNEADSENLNRSNSSATIDIFDDMSPPRRDEPETVMDEDPDIPDRSYGDYFCQLCDSHMNSEAMWTAHITGKRHLKSVEKGCKDTKYDTVNEESVIKEEIKKVKDPVVGLSYIHEVRRKDVGAPPIFKCFLCQANNPTVPLAIEHILTMKHRMNYVKETSPDEYQLLEGTHLKKGQMEPIVMDMAAQLEQRYGRGSVVVVQERSKIPPPYTYSTKRSLGTDDEDDRHSKKNLKSETRDRSKHNKDVDRRVRHSSSEDEDKRARRRSSPARNNRDIKPTYPKSYKSSSRDSYNDARDSYNDTRDSLYESRRDSYHSRKTSPMRSLHSRSPLRESRDLTRDNKGSGPYRVPYGPELPKSRIPYGPEPPPPFLNSVQAPMTSPNFPSSAPNRDDASLLQDFMRKIYILPSEIFFKLVLLKLDNTDFKCVEELRLVSKMIQKCQTILCEKLPPELQAVISQKVGQPIANLPVASQSPTHQSRPASSGDFSFIKEFLDHKKSLSVASSPKPAPSVAQPGISGVPPLKPPSFASQPQATSTQAYGNYSQAYKNPSPSTPLNMNSYQSSDPSMQNYASSSFQSNSYNTAASSNSSGIPGLSLAEENRERPNYSYGFPPNQSSHYPPSYGY